MATTSDNRGDPYADQLPGGGTSVVVWLIVGCAVLVGVIVVWDTRSRSQIRYHAAQVEREVRNDFRVSFRLLRDKNPGAVIARDAEIGEKLDWLMRVDGDGYRRLRVARLYIRGKAYIMLDDPELWRQAEADFSEGLSLMRRARGQAWELGLCGRGEARFKLGRHREALADFSSIIEVNPSFGAAYYWRSRINEELGDTTAADRDAARARALDSWPPIVNFARAEE